MSASNATALVVTGTAIVVDIAVMLDNLSGTQPNTAASVGTSHYSVPSGKLP